jgi:hypothetical protein
MQRTLANSTNMRVVAIIFALTMVVLLRDTPTWHATVFFQKDEYLLGPFYRSSSSSSSATATLNHFGSTGVLGAGRAVGSAIVALLVTRGIPVHAIDDGRTGILSVIDFNANSIDEADITLPGELARVLGTYSADIQRGGAPAPVPITTLFVDMDPFTSVAGSTYGLPNESLVCALAGPQARSTHVTRIVFLRGDSASLSTALSTCTAASSETSSTAIPVSRPIITVALVEWPNAQFLGVGIDPTAKGEGGGLQGTLNDALQCLAAHADTLPLALHNFKVPLVLDAFSRATTGVGSGVVGCTTQVITGARTALKNGLSTSNAAGDALTVAEQLFATNDASRSTTSRVNFRRFIRNIDRLDPGTALACESQCTASKLVLRNSLPTYETLAPVEAAVLLNNMGDSLKDVAPLSKINEALAVYTNALWWTWRQSLLRGFRDPEPLPFYDPAVMVGSSSPRYALRDMFTFGVSHSSSNGIKMRHAQATWGWRMKRGGIVWSSDAPDALVPVHVVNPVLGTDYNKLALRVMEIWMWVLATYPRHAWYVRAWDDNFLIAERYLDIANVHEAGAKIAIGRTLKAGKNNRNVYLSGGPPALFSAGWAALLRNGASTCLSLFEVSVLGGERHIPDIVQGRGTDVHVKRLISRMVDSHCSLGCEDLVIEWCLRDIVGAYYEHARWQGFETLNPSEVNRFAMIDCKALACRRRVARKDVRFPLLDPENHPLQVVTFHYVTAPQMVWTEAELYGMAPGSEEWVAMCEKAQARPECQEDILPMPLPTPWSLEKSPRWSVLVANNTKPGPIFG